MKLKNFAQQSQQLVEQGHGDADVYVDGEPWSGTIEPQTEGENAFVNITTDETQQG